MSVEEGGKGACLWSGIGRTGRHGEGDGEKGGNDGCFSFFFLFVFVFLSFLVLKRQSCLSFSPSVSTLGTQASLLLPPL